MAKGIILGAISIAVLCIAASMVWARRSFAPWLPSSRRMVTKALIAANPKPGERFADLGCGDGRIVTLAHKRFGLQAHGFEISLLPYFLAFIRIGLYKVWAGSAVQRKSAPDATGRVAAEPHVYFKNLFTVSLSDFDIIFLYGLPEALNTRLYEKMNHELRPGTRVISYNFSLAHKKPTHEFHERWRNVFLYQW